MDYNIVDQGLSSESNQYITSHKAPDAVGGFQTFFDFTVEALIQNKSSSVFHYLMFASFYGSYYYALIQPHSMYMIACSGFSFFFLVGFINHKMN